MYLSTKSDGDPVIVYNFDNNDKPNIGWRGNVMFKIFLPSLLSQFLLNQNTFINHCHTYSALLYSCPMITPTAPAAEDINTIGALLLFFKSSRGYLPHSL